MTKTATTTDALGLEHFKYDNDIVRKFAYATAFWGLIGMTVGLLAALQMIWPALNFTPETTFGRVRPLHTNAAIFAFVGNGIYMGVYYSLQRLMKARMWSDLFSSLHFYGWQLIIVAAALTLPLGISTGKEYAELEWPIDVAIALVWIFFGDQHVHDHHQAPRAAPLRSHLVLHRYLGNGYDAPHR
jgi:cytochrome c oxidase cbb3-type subunit I/II